MTRSIAVAVLLVLLVFSFASAREWVPFSDAPVAEEVATRIISTDISTTVIEVDVPGMLVAYSVALPCLVGITHYLRTKQVSGASAAGAA